MLNVDREKDVRAFERVNGGIRNARLYSLYGHFFANIVDMDHTGWVYSANSSYHVFGQGKYLSKPWVFLLYLYNYFLDNALTSGT